VKALQDKRDSWPQQEVAESPDTRDYAGEALKFLDVETCPAEVPREVWLAFKYEAVVLDGGHLQFFAEGGLAITKETRRALQVLGCGRQEEILAAAAKLYQSRERPAHYGLAELLSAVSLGEFCLFDTALERCLPTIEARIRTYFQEQASAPALQLSRRG
jgi:hypothetical protein